MAADVDRNSLSAQLLGAATGIGRRRYIRRINVVAVLSEEDRHGATAAGETDYCNLALARYELARCHRNFSVLSPMKAASTPRIQKRTTT